MRKRYHCVNCVTWADDGGKQLPDYCVKSSLSSKQLLQPAPSMLQLNS